MKTEQDALKLVETIKKKDPRIVTTVTKNGAKYVVKIELKCHGLQRTIHSEQEWGDFKSAWTVFD